jgi:hypothetical protein
MELTGKIYKIFDTQQIKETFKKRDVVIEYQDNPNYAPQLLKFEALQDRTELLDSFEEGQSVQVSFNLRGREWTSPKGEVKYFNSLVISQLQEASSGGGSNPSGKNQQSGSTYKPPQQKQRQAPAGGQNSSGGDLSVQDDPVDDLPF